MGNMCCRREVFAPNGADSDPSRCSHHQQQQHLSSNQEHHPSKQQRPTVMSSAYPGDDCAINELLEGRMDLDVLLPDGRQVRLTVERRTPMMDLLVQAASATKISPGGHVIHVFGDRDKSNGTLPYKPSTPIGSLDTNTIYIVPKKEAGDPLARRMGKTANRPFEPTFRVQVHLPRNQLTVLRMSPRVQIGELKTMVCKEKGLDTDRYQLVRPNGPTQPLAGDMTLAEYGSTEITLLSNSSIESHICNSTSHIIPYPKRTEEHKRKTGILRLLAEDNKHKNTNPISAHRVDNYQRNGHSKNEDINVHQNRYKPKKRRPAPPPPPPVLPEVISHSRQSSSDSSGYHEATSSFLHEEHSGEEKASSDSSGVSSLDAKVPSIQETTRVQQPPVPNPKKKKAPPPPPPPAQKEKEVQKETNVSDKLITENVSKENNSEKCKDIDLDEKLGSLKDPLEIFIVPTDTISKILDDSNLENFVINKDVILHQKLEPQTDSLKNSVVKTDSFSKMDFVGKDMIIQKDYTLKDPISKQESIVLENLIIQNGLMNSVIEKNPVLSEDLIIPKYAAHESMVVLNNDLNLKDQITQQDTLIRNDQSSQKDHVVLKDQVINQSGNSVGKLDTNPVCKNEAQNKLQSPMPSVTTKSLAIKSEITSVTEKEGRNEKLPEVKRKPETAKTTPNFVLDTYKPRTFEKKVEKHKSSCKSEAVSTKVALVALNARIEQNVTQQEIASSIQAAFHSLDRTPSLQPSLLAIKQRNSEDSLANGITYSDRSSESIDSPPYQKTIVTLNSESSDRLFKEPTKYDIPEKEALLIDEEEPPPRPASANSVSTTNLKRSSSLLNFADASPRNVPSKSSKRVRNLQRSLSDLSAEDKEDFEAEQERLQEEYIKLQRQFILWQQQLINNHAMLREECLVPQYARTLRQSHSLPEGEDYSDERPPTVPLVSRSLSYEPTKERCSTLPRSTINIPSLEFGSIQINSGTTTLRSSKTKNYFKPPQVRVSTKSRQRIPPEIKKEGDVDITDDAKMLTTILPSFESLKLITENSEEDIQLSVSRLKDVISKTKLSPPQERRKIHQSFTFPKLNSRLNNGEKISNRELTCVNGDTGQSKLSVEGSKISEQSFNSQLPPPPPPMPVSGVSRTVTKENCIKPLGQRNGISKKNFTPTVDPREQLMLEIRKFGGRTALRKISLAS